MDQVFIQSSNRDDDYDSEDEERRRKINIIERIHRRARPNENQDAKDKMILCGRCSSPICAVSALEPAANINFNTFKLTNCFGYVFIEVDAANEYYAACCNKHKIGLCIDGFKYVNQQSQLLVNIQGRENLPWIPQVWQNNFAYIGGPNTHQQQDQQDIDLESPQALYCEICKFQSKNRRQFISHVLGSKHKAAEKYLMESMS